MSLALRSATSAFRHNLVMRPHLPRTFSLQRTQFRPVSQNVNDLSFVRKVLFRMTGLKPLNPEERTQAIHQHQKLFAAHASVHNHDDAEFHLERSHNLQLFFEPKDYATHKRYVTLLDKKKEDLTPEEIDDILAIYKMALKQYHNFFYTPSLLKKFEEYSLLKKNNSIKS